MNKNSYICKLIQKNPDKWQEIIKEKRIRIKEADGFTLFIYEDNANFYDPIVQEARGIIIDIENLEVACFPFRKFGNSHEGYVDNIDWNTASIQEKIDGCIIKYWYNYKKDAWQFATNTCIDAKDAAFASGKNALDIIQDTNEFKILKNANLNKEYTYIFELVTPYKNIVIKYDENKLYFIGMRNNKTGKEVIPDTAELNLPRPKLYQAKNLNDCISLAKTINKSEYPDLEGFVVVDKDFHRIKVKTPQYVIMHHAVTFNIIKKESLYEMLQIDDFNLEDFKAQLPKPLLNDVEFYLKAFEQTQNEIKKTIAFARNLQNLGVSRKEINEFMQNERCGFYGLKALNVNDTPDEIIKNLDSRHFLQLIPDKE